MADRLRRTEDEESIVFKLSIETGESPITTTTAATAAVMPTATISTTEPSEKAVKDPVHRPRYVWKTRSRLLQHEPPATMMQYKLKPWKAVPEQPSGSEVVEKDKDEGEDLSETLGESNTKEDRKDIKKMSKIGLIRCFGYEHPVVTLDVGTLHANIRRALTEDSIPVPNEATSSLTIKATTNQSSLTPELITNHINKAANAAALAKRKLQRLVGGFIHVLFSTTGAIKASDREILDHICPRPETSADTNAVPVVEGKKKKKRAAKSKYNQIGFIGMLTRCLYSGNPPGLNGVGEDVRQFLKRAEDLGLLPKREFQPTRNVMEFPAMTVTRSIACDLGAQFSRMYNNGSLTLQAKVFIMGFICIKRVTIDKATILKMALPIAAQEAA